jgi:tetratricopeptide (TPR) repeat protein
MPNMNDVSLLFGCIIILLMVISFVKFKLHKKGEVIFGLLWFVMFLIPVFFTTKRFGEIFFEQRLYVPIIGIILLINSVFFSNSFFSRNFKITVVAIWFIISFFSIKTYIQVFENPITFWSKIGKENPNSAYCNKTAALNLLPYSQNKDVITFIEKAYLIDSSEAKVKYLYAKYILLPQNNINAAKVLLENEIITNSKFASAFFERGMISFNAQKYSECIPYFKKFIELKPEAIEGCNNLLLCYELEKKWSNAYNCAIDMNKKGFEVKPEELKLLEDSTKTVAARSKIKK